MGIPNLDVGTIPRVEADIDADDPEAIAKLTAHIVARVADRFGFLRKLSRNMEGNDRRAGLLSDVFGVAVNLYKRNPELIELLAMRARQDFRERRLAKQQSSPNGRTTAAKTQPQGVPHA